MTGYSPEFDWNPANDTDHCIVVRHQPAIAVYTNPPDEVVIRQQDQYDESDDHFVFITKDNVLKVAERMLAVAGISMAMACMEGGGLAEPLLLHNPTPLTGAERQRRYRNKHRNGNDDASRNELSLLLVNGAEHQEELAG
jgi:hypothetical protein